MSRYSSSKTGSFSATIDSWVADTKERLVAVTRAAVGDVINEAQLPGPSVANPGADKGGKMPIATGFLRASGTSHLNSLPSGPTRGESKELNSYPSADDYTSTPQVGVDLAAMSIDDIFYFGWTAEYARAMNLKYGFVDAAIQNWQSHVSKRANELMKRSGK